MQPVDVLDGLFEGPVHSREKFSLIDPDDAQNVIDAGDGGLANPAPPLKATVSSFAAK